MMFANISIVRIAAVGSLLVSVIAFAVNALPNGTISDNLFYASILLRWFLPELTILFMLGGFVAAAYVTQPLVSASLSLRWLNRDREARGMRFIVYVVAACIGGVVLVVFVVTALAWGRYTFVYIREDLLNAHLRRSVLLEARVEEARGDLPLAVLKLKRFARMFPDRSEVNDIDGEVARLEAKILESYELTSIADQLESSAGISEAVVELRSVALSRWPANLQHREKLAESLRRWERALNAYDTYRSSCASDLNQDLERVALTLVVLGYRHPEHFPGATSLDSVGTMLCSLVRGLEDNIESRFWLKSQAEIAVNSTNPVLLDERARKWQDKVWSLDTNRYYAASMKSVKHSFLNLNYYGNIEQLSELYESDGENEADVEVFTYSSFLIPALMLNPAVEESNEDGDADLGYVNKSWPIDVIVGAGDAVLLCWNRKTDLPDIAFSGSTSLTEIASIKNCNQSRREFAPLIIRTDNVKRFLGDLLSSSVERVSSRRQALDRQMLRSLCFMIARLPALDVAASDQAVSICKLEITLDSIGRSR